jgi:hypothetical protein
MKFPNISDKARGSADEYLFKTDVNEEEYREYARNHPSPDLARWDIFHPYCRDEWIKMGIEPPKKEEN